MQNILAAQSEGTTLRNTYININAMSSSHTFIIPVYENMPGDACSRPDTNGSSSTDVDVVKVNVDQTLRIRNNPNGTETVGWLYKDEIVTRLEKATSKVGGTYWDKVRKSNGVVGYAARETYDGESQYKLYLVPVNDNGNNGNSDNGNNNENNNGGNSNSGNDTANVKIDKANNIITVTPNVIAFDILNAFGGSAKITKADGSYLNGGNDLMATGFIVEDKYTVVKKGDCNGDGVVDTGDTYILKCVILNMKKFDNEYYKKAADINNDNSLDTGDTYILKKQILGLTNIGL